MVGIAPHIYSSFKIYYIYTALLLSKLIKICWVESFKDVVQQIGLLSRECVGHVALSLPLYISFSAAKTQTD